MLVAQSMGALTAPLVCDRRPVALMVLVAPLVPAPGEPPGSSGGRAPGSADARRAAGEAAGWDAEDGDPATMFLHDVPDEVVAGLGGPRPRPVRDAVRGAVAPSRLARRSDPRPGLPPRPVLPAGPPAPGRRARLGITPDEMDGGHLPALHSPVELAARLDAYAAEVLPRPDGD